MKCPSCKSDIQEENINIKADIAHCTNCQLVFTISEITKDHIDDGFNINDRPNGTWFIKHFNTTIIGASTRSQRSIPTVLFALFFLSSGVPLISTILIVKGEFDLFLLGIAFLVFFIFLVIQGLMAIWGKVEIRLDNQGGEIFTGIGNVGLTKTFLWREISSLKEERRGKKGIGLVFGGMKKVSFGFGLPAARRKYMFQAIRSIMYKNRWKKYYA